MSDLVAILFVCYFRFNVLEGNLMVSTIAASYGFDVVDLHYYLLHQVSV